jgi:thiol-disulfide isomerase/thioredoxin
MQAGLPTATPFVAYPPPGNNPLGAQTPEPYPGPGSQNLPNPTAIFTPARTDSATSSGPATPTATLGIAGELITATLTATPGLVRTQLEASDSHDFTLASGQTQLVEFFAFWSLESKSMAPVMYALEDKYHDRIHFVYLDIEDPANSLFKTLLHDQLLPVFFLLDGEGKITHEWEGLVKTEDFESIFSSMALP